MRNKHKLLSILKLNKQKVYKYKIKEMKTTLKINYLHLESIPLNAKFKNESYPNLIMSHIEA